MLFSSPLEAEINSIIQALNGAIMCTSTSTTRVITSVLVHRCSVEMCSWRGCTLMVRYVKTTITLSSSRYVLVQRKLKLVLCVKLRILLCERPPSARAITTNTAKTTWMQTRCIYRHLIAVLIDKRLCVWTTTMRASRACWARWASSDSNLVVI